MEHSLRLRASVGWLSANPMVNMPLARPRTFKQLEELTVGGLKKPDMTLVPDAPECGAQQRQPLPTVNDCLAKVQLARAALLSQITEATRGDSKKLGSERALEKAEAELGDVLDQAAFVFLGFMLGAHQLRSKVLPGFLSAVSRGKRTSAATVIGLAQSTISEMLASTEQLEQRYTSILKKVLRVLPNTLDCTVHSEAHLSQLEPAFDLSALFSHVQASLAALEARTQRLRGVLLRHGRHAGSPPDCAEVYEALEDLCERCCPNCAAEGPAKV